MGKYRLRTLEYFCFLKSKFSTSIELNFAVLKFKHTIKKKKK